MGAQTTVAVIGAKGRMGATVCRAVTAAPDLRLVGEYDQGDDLGDLGGAQVVVEFSVPDASLGNVMACVQRGVHVVVGTTGWDEAKLAPCQRAWRPHPRREVALRSGCSSPPTSPSGRFS